VLAHYPLQSLKCHSGQKLTPENKNETYGSQCDPSKQWLRHLLQQLNGITLHPSSWMRVIVRKESTMRIIIIGATGTIGQKVVDALAGNDIISVGHSRGEIQVDLASTGSIRKMFDMAGEFDAVVSTAGSARFGTLEELSDDDFTLGLNNKLMGQVNLIRIGYPLIHSNGSFTLTCGVLSQEPVVGSSAISIANAGVEAFVRAVALELPRGIRANVVSPIWVSETLVARGGDSASGMPAEKVAQAYVKCIYGDNNGDIFDVRRLG
jgi:NAD(P)-dependent dehydrogenase (short-subunit alcohol dehydrogenase family)